VNKSDQNVTRNALVGLAAAAAFAIAKQFIHDRVCAERWADVRNDLQRGERRMGRVERLMWAAVVTLFTLLLTVIGFMLTHPYTPPWRP